MEMALAIPTLFFIPPESSEGYRLFLPTRFTRSRQKLARSRFSAADILVNRLSGKMMFCSTVMESNRAEF